MGDAKHTPGPWLAATAASSIVGLPVVAQSGRSIASVTYFGLGAPFEGHNQECHANARLIAAAPDLVEALKEYREALMMGPLEIAAKFGPDFNPDDILIEADKKAVAALSKAGV